MLKNKNYIMQGSIVQCTDKDYQYMYALVQKVFVKRARKTQGHKEKTTHLRIVAFESCRSYDVPAISVKYIGHATLDDCISMFDPDYCEEEKNSYARSRKLGLKISHAKERIYRQANKISTVPKQGTVFYFNGSPNSGSEIRTASYMGMVIHNGYARLSTDKGTRVVSHRTVFSNPSMNAPPPVTYKQALEHILAEQRKQVK